MVLLFDERLHLSNSQMWEEVAVVNSQSITLAVLSAPLVISSIPYLGTTALVVIPMRNQQSELLKHTFQYKSYSGLFSAVVELAAKCIRPSGNAMLMHQIAGISQEDSSHLQVWKMETARP